MNRYTIFSILSLVVLATVSHAMELDKVITKQVALERAKKITDICRVRPDVKDRIFEDFKLCLDKIKQDTISEAMISRCMQELRSACRTFEAFEREELRASELIEVVISSSEDTHREEPIPDRYLALLEKTATNLEKILEIKQNKIRNAPSFFRRNLPIFLIITVALGTLAGWVNFSLGVTKTVPHGNNGTQF